MVGKLTKEQVAVLLDLLGQTACTGREAFFMVELFRALELFQEDELVAKV